jgi:hypothetical protein
MSEAPLLIRLEGARERIASAAARAIPLRRVTCSMYCVENAWRRDLAYRTSLPPFLYLLYFLHLLYFLCLLSLPYPYFPQ